MLDVGDAMGMMTEESAHTEEEVVKVLLLGLYEGTNEEVHCVKLVFVHSMSVDWRAVLVYLSHFEGNFCSFCSLWEFLC